MDYRKQPGKLARYVGSSFISKITDNGEFAALRIGNDAWSKHEVATRLGVTHTVSCGILSAFCRKIGIQNTEHLYKETSPHSLAEHRLGVTTLYVMFAAFADKGLNVDQWYQAGGEKKAVVSFLTMKHRELEARKETEKSEKKRKGGKRPTGGEGTVSKYLGGRV